MPDAEKDAGLFAADEIDERGALISDDGLYRYVLGRRWARDGQVATFIMLNPSTADATEDDPTIRRCVGFAKAWGMTALHVVNLYALRSTDPKGLWRVGDPVGPENDRHLTSHAMAACTNGSPLIAAWGANAKPDRVAQVLALPGMVALQALGSTKAGAPRHPLYLRADARPEPWPTRVTSPVVTECTSLATCLDPDGCGAPEVCFPARVLPPAVPECTCSAGNAAEFSAQHATPCPRFGHPRDLPPEVTQP